jgi:V8-like Glu-specific endopeptidase
MVAKFSSEPKTTWLAENGDDRNMQMVEQFSFIDRRGKTWIAPTGSIINGASIPESLWSIVGSPFVGDYRRASIVHDIACQEATNRKARRAADRMFFQACRAGGCSRRESIVLYVGVRIGAWWRYKAFLKEESLRPKLIEQESDRTLKRLFSMTADEVLQAGETDDIEELEKRVDSIELHLEEKAFSLPLSFELVPPETEIFGEEDGGSLDDISSSHMFSEDHSPLPMAAEDYYLDKENKRACGEEDRLPCSNSKQFPYSAICYLIIRKSFGRASRGTGFFISPNTVVTAGHCLRSGFGAVKSIQIIPGRMAGDWPFGSVYGKRWFVPQQWSRRGDPRFDYGVIKLDDSSVGESAGHFNFGIIDEKDLEGAAITTSGYPSDMELSTLQHFNSGPCEKVSSQRLSYSLDTWKGASGSPVWIERNGSPFVVGIHNYGHCPNHATRINQQVFEDLNRWIKS